MYSLTKQVIAFNQRNINLNILLRNNWYYLWSNKIDNIEYSINHLMHKYKLLYNSIYYYIGLTGFTAENDCITYKLIQDRKTKGLPICYDCTKHCCYKSKPRNS